MQRLKDDGNDCRLPSAMRLSVGKDFGRSAEAKSHCQSASKHAGGLVTQNLASTLREALCPECSTDPAMPCRTDFCALAAPIATSRARSSTGSTHSQHPASPVRPSRCWQAPGVLCCLQVPRAAFPFREQRDSVRAGWGAKRTSLPQTVPAPPRCTGRQLYAAALRCPHVSDSYVPRGGDTVQRSDHEPSYNAKTRRKICNKTR